VGPLAVEQPGDLERVERVAPGRARDANQRRTGESAAEGLADDPVQSSHRQRAEFEPLEELARESDRPGPLGLGTQGDDCPNRLVGESPDRELDRRGRRPVEPVDVVDGEHDRSLGGQCTQDGEDGRPDQPPTGRARRLRLEKDDVDRLALRGRQGGHQARRNRREDVRESCERELRLGLGRSGHEHRGIGFPRPEHSVLPDRRLPDAGLADDGEHAGTAVVPQKRFDDRDLGLAPDDRCHG
jgi:hypothetical protein